MKKASFLNFTKVFSTFEKSKSTPQRFRKIITKARTGSVPLVVVLDEMIALDERLTEELFMKLSDYFTRADVLNEALRVLVQGKSFAESRPVNELDMPYNPDSRFWYRYTWAITAIIVYGFPTIRMTIINHPKDLVAILVNYLENDPNSDPVVGSSVIRILAVLFHERPSNMANIFIERPEFVNTLLRYIHVPFTSEFIPNLLAEKKNLGNADIAISKISRGTIRMLAEEKILDKLCMIPVAHHVIAKQAFSDSQMPEALDDIIRNAADAITNLSSRAIMIPHADNSAALGYELGKFGSITADTVNSSVDSMLIYTNPTPFFAAIDAACAIALNDVCSLKPLLYLLSSHSKINQFLRLAHKLGGGQEQRIFGVARSQQYVQEHLLAKVPDLQRVLEKIIQGQKPSSFSSSGISSHLSVLILEYFGLVFELGAKCASYDICKMGLPNALVQYLKDLPRKYHVNRWIRHAINYSLKTEVSSTLQETWINESKIVEHLVDAVQDNETNLNGELMEIAILINTYFLDQKISSKARIDQKLKQAFLDLISPLVQKEEQNRKGILGGIPVTKRPIRPKNADSQVINAGNDLLYAMLFTPPSQPQQRHSLDSKTSSSSSAVASTIPLQKDLPGEAGKYSMWSSFVDSFSNSTKLVNSDLRK